MVKIAVDMVGGGLIDRATAVLRVDPSAARRAAAPDDRSEGAEAGRWRQGACPRRRARRGRIVFTADDAVAPRGRAASR
jgi:hypothetical protein